jgi:transposase-like protein
MRRSVLEPVALHCRIVLAFAEGSYVKEVAQRLDLDPHPVGKWRRRFLVDRLEGAPR